MVSRAHIPIVLCVVLFLTQSTAASAKVAVEPPLTRDRAEQALELLGLSIQKLTLENGLRVVMSVDHSAPTVAVCVMYNVGSRNERPGQSGFAHLFEHMMFQGSRNVPKGGHFTLISERGGVLNGTTSPDRTVYFETLPATELPLALWLEADRMRWLDVTPENFENQRKVVQEEFRMRVTNAAYAPSRIRLTELVYDDYWPYSHPTIGSMEDLAAAQFDWVREFHARYYVPNNAVLVVAGDFDPDHAARLIHEYFSAIPGSSRDAPEVPPPSKPRGEQHLETVHDTHAKTPGVYYAWRIPPAFASDHEPLEMAGMILTGGESSRLHQKLVRQLGIARDVASWTWDRRGPDAFTVQVLLTSGSDVATVRRILESELHRLADTPVTEAELLRVKNLIRSDFMFRLQSNRTRATELATFELFWGDARLLARQLQRYTDVDAARIQRAVMTYLGAAGRTVVEVVPDQAANTAEVQP